MQNTGGEQPLRKGVIGPEDYEDYGNFGEEGPYFADEFDKSSPYYHGGDETPVPFDMMRIPVTMATVYPEEEAKLKQLFETRYQIQDPLCSEIEGANEGLRNLKKSWGAVNDAILLRLSQMEASQKLKAKADGKKPSILNQNIKDLLASCTNVEKAYQVNQFFHGFEPDTLKTMEYIQGIDKEDPKVAKREVKKRIEKLAKLFLSLQNQLIQQLKERKNQLMPGLKSEFTEIIKQVDNKIAPLVNNSGAAMDESEICEKPSHVSNTDKFNTIINSKHS